MILWESTSTKAGIPYVLAEGPKMFISCSFSIVAVISLNPGHMQRKLYFYTRHSKFVVSQTSIT